MRACGRPGSDDQAERGHVPAYLLPQRQELPRRGQESEEGKAMKQTTRRGFFGRLAGLAVIAAGAVGVRKVATKSPTRLAEITPEQLGELLAKRRVQRREEAKRALEADT